MAHLRHPNVRALPACCALGISEREAPAQHAQRAWQAAAEHWFLRDMHAYSQPPCSLQGNQPMSGRRSSPFWVSAPLRLQSSRNTAPEVREEDESGLLQLPLSSGHLPAATEPQRVAACNPPAPPTWDAHVRVLHWKCGCRSILYSTAF